MNKLLATDLHIDKKSLNECDSILSEIYNIIQIRKIDHISFLGDSFDTINPSSDLLDFFSAWLIKFNIPVLLIAADSHESSSKTSTILNHFATLNKNIEVTKEWQDGHLFLGHFGIKQSITTYGGTVDKDTLSKYKYVFLGHFHNHELIKPNICQLSSARFVKFDEAPHPHKYVVLIEDYRGPAEKVSFLPLKSPIPMISLEIEGKEAKYMSNRMRNEAAKQESLKSPSQTTQKARGDEAICEVLTKLDQITPKTKVRVVFKRFEDWAAFLPHYQTYEKKFIVFKVKKDFIVDMTQVEKKTERISMKESLRKYLEAQNIPATIKTVLLEELK